MSDEIDEIWALYADDGAQALQAAEEALILLKADATDPAGIAALFRALHTFKGNSRLLGLTVIESRAHIAEDIVGLIRDEQVLLDPEILQLLFEATDALRGMLDEVIVSRRDAVDTPTADLVARMQRTFERCRASLAAPLNVPELPQDSDAPRDTSPAEISDGANDAPSDMGSISISTSASRLGDNPLYFEIFLELSGQTLTDVEAIAGGASEADADKWLIALEASIRLRESAERLGLDEWAIVARNVSEAVGNPERLAPTLEALRLMHTEGLRRLQPDSLPDDMRHAAASETLFPAGGETTDQFLSRVSPFITTLAGIGVTSFQKTTELLDATQKLADAAKDAGYDRLTEVAAQVSMAQDSESFDAALFDLYVVMTLFGDGDLKTQGLAEPSGCPPQSLAGWCLAKGESILGKLALAINGCASRELDWEEIGALARHLWCVFDARKLDTACHVTSALQDLVARLHSGEISPDPALPKILISFLEAGKLLLRDKRRGANEASADDLLWQTSQAISRLCRQGADPDLSELELPESFVGTLSRENLVRIRAAVATGSNFFVIRADTENDPETAAAFVDWLSNDAQSLASVTVFENGTTCFDFLVATRLEQASVIAALSAMDPSGAALRFNCQVVINPDASSNGRPAMPLHEGVDDNTRDASPTVIESVGEIITAHATLRLSLQKILDDDALRDIERSLRSPLRRSNEDDESASQALQKWRATLDRLLTHAEQISGNLEHLQREFVASRLLSSEAMLSELGHMLTARAHDAGIEVSLTITGVDERVDADILNQLNAASKPLLDLAIEDMMLHRDEGQPANWIVSVALDNSDKRVSLSIESRFSHDGNREDNPANDDMMLAARTLRARGGDFERILLPESQGARYVLSAPQSMVVLDGMIMRAGGINYVIPVESIERIVHVSNASTRRISADGGRLLLRIDHDTTAPIVHLCRESASEHLQAEPASKPINDEMGLFIIANDEGRLAALPVDELLGQQPLLVRPLKGFLSSIPRVNGCAPLGDGGVGMVINPAALFDSIAQPQ